MKMWMLDLFPVHRAALDARLLKMGRTMLLSTAAAIARTTQKRFGMRSNVSRGAVLFAFEPVIGS